MITLGISAYYHDSSAALVSDGEVVAAAAEERFTRQKHDSNFPRFAIDFCLNEAGLSAQEVDRIIFYEEPHVKFTRVLASSLSVFPFSRSAFVRSMRVWVGEKLWIKNEISKKLNVHPNKIDFIPHHLSHAAQAFIASPFEDAAVLTVDAVGEWSSTSLFSASRRGRLELKQLDDIPYPHSLGLAYSVFTAFLGFRPNDGECSTMALASFGNPVFADEIRKIIRVHQDGSYRLDQSYFNFNQFGDIPFSNKFIKVFGQPRGFKQKLPFDTLVNSRDGKSGATRDQQRYADIAASIQLVLEETLLHLVSRLHKMTGAKNLCLAGGVALNCVANSRILSESPFDNTFIPPDPGDGGAALGAALYSFFSTNGGAACRPPAATPYTGKQYGTARDEAMLRHIDPAAWASYGMEGSTRPKGVKLDFKTHDYFEDIIPGVVDDLRAGKIVGWVQGRFEQGPRALGNRSLLVDPKSLTAARRMSETVKSRASFRPYAFTVAEEDACNVLELGDKPQSSFKWMQMVAKVKQDAAPAVRAAIHSDGTTRPQICSKGDNERYHALLTAYGQATGLSALLNTSFNESGYPIVSSPTDALLVFARTDIDTIVINNLVVRKVF
ncbi:MAG TPA: carbamoyltransferase N-terminal domain-containing protein [Blastocatellia bacterium]|jgi:carbamoyltransferase